MDCEILWSDCLMALPFYTMIMTGYNDSKVESRGRGQVLLLDGLYGHSA